MTTTESARFLRAYQPHNCFGTDTLYMNWGLWDERTEHVDAAARALVWRLGELAELGPNTSLLDVGFGFGDQLIDWCKRQGLARAEGVNICPEQTSIAERRIAEAGLSDRVHVQVADAIAVPFDDESFDAVTAVECAFHFESRELFFREARRVLKTGGRLVLADFIGLECPRVMNRLAQWVSARAWRFSTSAFIPPREYAELLERAGFRDVDVDVVTDKVIAPCLDYARRRVWERDLRARMDGQSWLGTAAGLFISKVLGDPGAGEYVLVRAVRR